MSDDGILAQKPPSPWMRWIEGIGCSIVLAVASRVVLLWLEQIQGLPQENIPPLKVVILISWGIGLAIGYVVPHWYRSLPTRSSAGEEASDQVNWGIL
ncbi:MAG: hypothetical protein JSW26_26365 [Desulfobacterales bacterium]|nr:MAG: hypothetical protein JSW26_26365 [Desulfobacterales bacterium]